MPPDPCALGRNRSALDFVDCVKLEAIPGERIAVSLVQSFVLSVDGIGENMNRRLENRDPSHFDAEVQLEAAAVGCTVEDISEGGARLKFKVKPKLPATFELLLPLFAGYKDRRAAELRWTEGNAVGVRFLLAQGEAAVRPSSFAGHVGWLN